VSLFTGAAAPLTIAVAIADMMKERDEVSLSE